MSSLGKWRWVCLHDFLEAHPISSLESILDQTEIPHRTEYQIGDRVHIKNDGLHWLIVSEEEVPGTVVCKKKITEQDLENFYHQQKKLFKPSFLPILEEVISILRRIYLNRVTYCVHIDGISQDGSDLFFNLPWACSKHSTENLCSGHGNEEMKYSHYTCHYFCI